MAIALAVFAPGKRFYAKESDQPKVIGDGFWATKEQLPVGTMTGLADQIQGRDRGAEGSRSTLKLQTLGRIGSLFILIMFFWAIFDQSASTWIFFADTYMDLHMFGYPVTADQIQAVNALFIMTMLPLSVIVFNTLAKKGWKIRATDKMIAGFILTALSMVIMSSAGFLSGQKRDAIKVTFKEGEIILPMSEVKMADVKPENGKSVLKFPDAVQMIVTDWEYNADKKKATLANGELILGDGKILTISKGRVDFDHSRSLFAVDEVKMDGTLETLLNPGDYQMGSDKLTLGPGNTAKVTSATSVEAPKDKEPPKVTLEKVDWVKPAERVTVWWQILSFLVLTMAEILISVTGLELAFVAAPQNMKSFVTACWLVTVGMANLFINAPITRLYPDMDPGPYFAMLAGALVVVAVAFIPVAGKFNRAMAEAKKEEALEANAEAT